jgi:thiamine-phosphate pyrophosphorylase
MRGLDPLVVARGCLSGGARLLQVRQKGHAGGSSALLELVRRVIASAAPFGAAIIVNDRADIAAMAGAAGVHVGQQDLPLPAVRAIAGERAILGVSTHTLEQIDEALKGTADYVAVGPVFRTSTKETGYEPRGLEIIRYAAGRGKPVVAIGGVTAENAPALLAAGASSVAVISELVSDTDVAGHVRHLLQALQG